MDLRKLSQINNAQFAKTVRDHWRIENSQHWVLDVQFGEDANRSRKDHSAANLAVIRRMALIPHPAQSQRGWNQLTAQRSRHEAQPTPPQDARCVQR